MSLAPLAVPVVRAIQDNKVSPGVLGFLVVAVLGVATWLLIRSMNKQMRKVDFDEDEVEAQRRPRPDPAPPVHPDGDAGSDSTGESSPG